MLLAISPRRLESRYSPTRRGGWSAGYWQSTCRGGWTPGAAELRSRPQERPGAQLRRRRPRSHCRAASGERCDFARSAAAPPCGAEAPLTPSRVRASQITITGSEDVATRPADGRATWRRGRDANAEPSPRVYIDGECAADSGAPASRRPTGACATHAGAT